jgi:hypothetical protein
MPMALDIGRILVANMAACSALEQLPTIAALSRGNAWRRDELLPFGLPQSLKPNFAISLPSE